MAVYEIKYICNGVQMERITRKKADAAALVWRRMIYQMVKDNAALDTAAGHEAYRMGERCAGFINPRMSERFSVNMFSNYGAQADVVEIRRIK